MNGILKKPGKHSTWTLHPHSWPVPHMESDYIYISQLLDSFSLENTDKNNSWACLGSSKDTLLEPGICKLRLMS